MKQDSQTFGKSLPRELHKPKPSCRVVNDSKPTEKKDEEMLAMGIIIATTVFVFSFVIPAFSMNDKKRNKAKYKA